ncbi:ornithine carbamoyltransferase [Buchnera aphidicola (Nipponaphis monzeni)]|uniref:Ornithine carbamoyltransferase n=1 Tax=Buchnera aphidicola (Nipponaphis monzeni) TaxID=2495405 RepID=A0A455TAB9_9GAMM|nr:ornithine carbamoyltransferase [Buchnera aphidicola]BBI01291.1 ornithine carbamoyltransferase [Buchnera aphidicola (Nipponaphis monzeni)]
MNTLYKRNFLRLLDYTNEEITYLINLALTLKNKKKQKQEKQCLLKKNIILIFEQESTRTRFAFETAAFDQGAHVTYIGPGTIHMGYKESIQDTSKILSQYYNAIQYRGKSHQTIELLSKNSTIPIWNGLTNKFHPTQLLADLLTIQENSFKNKPLSEISWAYIGDTRNNIGYSILEATVLMGLDLRLIAPKKYWPDKDFLNKCILQGKKSNAKILCTEDIETGVNNVDYIYTDVWISMGDSKNIWYDKICDLKKYQVNSKVLSLTKNINTQILHCLPALHNSQTIIGNYLSNKYDLNDGVEITNEMFKSKNSIVFKQAENRLHTIKALMVATLCKNPYCILL